VNIVVFFSVNLK